MLELGLKVLIAYLLGAMLGSMLLGALRGVDIRRMGSGNAGATNALRTQGKFFAIAVLAIDIFKGLLAVKWLPAAQFWGIATDAGVDRHWLALACGMAVIVGHVYPIWFGFRGGKGVATVLGVVGALAPVLLLPVIASWLVVLSVSGYVGLASMLAGLGLVAGAYWLQPGDTPLLLFCMGVTLFIVYTHRSNIVRMRDGREHRLRGGLFPFRAA